MKKIALLLFLVGLVTSVVALDHYGIPAPAFASMIRASLITGVGSLPPVVEILYDVPMPTEHQLYALEVCRELGLDFTLFMALIGAESGYREKVISEINRNGTRDYGYAQLNDYYFFYFAKEAGVAVKSIECALDYRINLRIGASVLAGHYEYWSKQEHVSQEALIDLVLTSYNRGRGWAIENGRFDKYVGRVLRFKQALEEGSTYEYVIEN